MICFGIYACKVTTSQTESLHCMIPKEKRLKLLEQLRSYLQQNSEEFQEIKYRALNANAWFTMENIDLAVKGIEEEFLSPEKLIDWANQYPEIGQLKTVGIIMAGNIPLVGFHDFLCGFVSGHILKIKPSSKDEILLKHFVYKLIEWQSEVQDMVQFPEQLTGCDAYIATGSNNSSRYFEQYFGKYPNIIRKNRTSIALLNGDETEEEMQLLAKDFFSYFGLGCRNVTQVLLPKGYNFEKIFNGCKAFEDLILHHKYKNNYDYHLAIYLLNKIPYWTNNSMLLVENEIPFSAVSVLHFKYYDDLHDEIEQLINNESIQTIVGKGFTPFGQAQKPSLFDYADGVDTMKFLSTL